MDPEEESVEESLDDSSLEDSPGSLFLFRVGGLGALLGCPLGGRWGLGLGFGAVWGAARGFGGWGCTGGAHADVGGGGAGGFAATCWQCGGAGDRFANAAPPLDARRENAATGCHVVHHGCEGLDHGDGLQVQLLKQGSQKDGPWIASGPTKDHPNGARVRRVDLHVLHLHGG